MFLNKYFYSHDPRIDPALWAEHYLWRPGTKIIDGDSNAFPICPDRVDMEATLTAWPGKIPQDSIDEFNRIRERHARTPITEAYLQTGGNLWTWYPLKSLDMNLSVFQEQMHYLITLLLSILPGKDIVIASLPFVKPDLRYSDVKKYDGEGSIIRKIMALRLNDFFKCGNIILKAQCQKLGVQFLDIYAILEAEWKQYGKSHWWDEVHYDQRPRGIIEKAIQIMWRT